MTSGESTQIGQRARPIPTRSPRTRIRRCRTRSPISSTSSWRRRRRKRTPISRSACRSSRTTPYGQPAEGYDGGREPTGSSVRPAPAGSGVSSWTPRSDEGEEISDFDVLAEADEDRCGSFGDDSFFFFFFFFFFGSVHCSAVVCRLHHVLGNLIFANRFRDVGSSTIAFGTNLLGAIVGGILEYGALIVGYRSLLVGVAALYALALITGRSHLALRSRTLACPPAPADGRTAVPTGSNDPSGIGGAGGVA